MTTISTREAANRTRRAMALRDLMLEAGWDAERITREGQDGWEALARTITLRTGRLFRIPSVKTQEEALGLLTGARQVVEVQVTAPAATPAPAPRVTAADLARLGRGSAIGANGRPRVPTNVSLMVD
jgi:hypothetical protein